MSIVTMTCDQSVTRASSGSTATLAVAPLT
jgi:hypothetical protein